MPMGFCHPGSGKSGDAPRRPEWAPLCHDRLFARMKEIRIVLLMGRYAQAHYLGAAAGENLTETVRADRDPPPRSLPLPHLSPRNQIGLRRNSGFPEQMLPELRDRVAQILQTDDRA
ncbi:uracil-DNA glycosylase family protein [Myxococcota bacterium]|nr:uracil-DNA glycosylase family protein [Myxococcota bacterium]